MRPRLPRLLAGALLGATASCAEPSAPPTVAVGATGVTITAEDGLLSARLVDPAGAPVLTRRLPAPVETLELRHIWPEAGTHTLELTSTTGSWTLSVPVAAASRGEVRVEAPVGELRQVVADGEQVPLTLLGGGAATVAVHALAVTPGPARISVGEDVTGRERLLPGERLVAMAEVDTETPVIVEVGGETTRFTLVPRPVSREAAQRTLRVADIALPADSSGALDLGRPTDRVSLPGAAWQRVLRTLGLGFRPRDPGVPWAHVGVTLENTGETPANVVLRLRVLDEDGQPAPAFQPALRGRGDGQDTVSALLRVPAGDTATAALPLYVDDRHLDAHIVATREWTRELAVLPMGASEPLHVDRRPLHVSRGGTAQGVGFALGVLSALLGGGLVALRGRRWLQERPTSDLMTIGLFSSLTFLVGAVGRVLTMGLATLLGPFAALLTGLVDDAFRYTLLATLVTLLPRPGTLALAVGTGWLLSGVATGGFGPTDLLFLGSRIFFLELLLWLTGVTRDPTWRDGTAAARFLRLGTGFGLASLASSAAGIALHMVLYRLFYADWYIAMMLLGPGFLYVVAACAVAVPFADSLRRVQR